MNVDSLKDFLETQRRYDALLIALYQHRNLGGISYESAIEILGGEEKNAEAKLKTFLAVKRLGLELDTGIILDPLLRDVYEKVLHSNVLLSDDAISRIRPEVENLCNEWDSCETANDKRSLISSLYQVLERIPSGLEQSIGDLTRLMEEDYKAAISLSLKRAKLNTLAERAKQIQKLLEESHQLLSDDTHKLRTVILRDPEAITYMISNVLSRAKDQLFTASESLIEVTRRLQEYISKVERATRVAKRAHLLSKKMSYGTLETETTFLDVIRQYEDIGRKSETYVMVNKVDVPSLIEEGRFIDELLQIASGELQGKEVNRSAPAIDFSEVNARPDREITPFRPDYRKLFRSFSAQGNDLFSFLIDYDFKKDVPTWQRIELFSYYCASREFQPLLEFAAGKTGNYLYTSPVSGRQISLDYQIVNNR